MSVTVKFNPDGDGVYANLVVTYRYGDHILLAKHIKCPSQARRYAEGYIRMLEQNRKLECLDTK